MQEELQDLRKVLEEKNVIVQNRLKELEKHPCGNEYISYLDIQSLIIDLINEIDGAFEE